jgi:hypothetical protein
MRDLAGARGPKTTAPCTCPDPRLAALRAGFFLTMRLVPRVLDLGTTMVTWPTPAHWRDSRRPPRYGRFMSKPGAVGLSLMVAGVCAYGTGPDWRAIAGNSVGMVPRP